MDPSKNPFLSEAEKLVALAGYVESMDHSSVKPGFYVRIELHGIDAEGYKKLYKFLEKAKFKEFILDGNSPYALPDATYFYEDAQNALASSYVHKQAVEAVAKAVASGDFEDQLLNKDATIVVAKTADMFWTGLKIY
jgi:hypothetical protein